MTRLCYTERRISHVPQEEFNQLKLKHIFM